MTLALVCAGLIAAFPMPDASPPDVSRAYEEVRSQAGRSPDDQVRLALWCEAHGLTAERLNHLALAVLADPKHATARGLMGLVALDGRWLRPDAVAARAQADPTLAEYDVRRQKTPYTADGQWALGVWCDEHGLKDQARAHLTVVTRLDPAREPAWKRLGYKRHEGRWATDAQLAADRADVEAQKQADKRWKPLLEKYKAMLDQPSRRDEAESALSAIVDSRAVPSIGRIFATSEATQPRAVRLLGQVDAPSASRALASLAVFAKSAEARRAAAETLRGRDPREYAALLIGLIRDPIKYEVKPVGGPGSPGVLVVEGKKANFKRFYAPTSAIQPGDSIGIDPFGRPVVRHPLDFHAHSRGSNPFNPHSMTGMAVTYSDLYTSWGQGTGDLAAIGLSPGHWNGAISETGDLYVPGPSGQGNLAFPMPGKADMTPAGFARALAGGHPAARAGASHPVAAISSPLASRGSAIANPRDFATETDVEFTLAQAIAETNKAAIASGQQLASDVAAIEATNRAVGEANERVVGILNSATGQNLPADRKAWERWWVDSLGYAQVAGQTATKPTFVEVIPSGYQPQVTPTNISTTRLMVNGISCFGGGTRVQTIAGPRPIESLRVGDRVLTQSTATGALGYRPILVVHHNPPSPTFVIRVAGDTIVSSPFHRFWKAGRGWVMARDIRPGDRLRTLDGVSEVEGVDQGKVQLVFNLDVAEDADFFAGSAAALVHDNTLPDPRLAPFDAAPAAVASARRGE